MANNNMQVFETQPERTDLPLVVMPDVIESMADSFISNFALLHNVARVRMYRDFTLDTETLLTRAADADVIIVIGFHVSDDMLKHLSEHVRCFSFGGTGVASYINLDMARQRGIDVRNIVHYGDHAVAEHAFALMLELAREAGKLNEQVKAGGWQGADGIGLHGKRLGLAGFGGIGRAMAHIANGFGMRTQVWNSHVDYQVAQQLGVTTVDDLGDLFATSDIVSLHLPLTNSTRGIITADHLNRLRSGTLFINTARAEIIEQGALTKRLMLGDIRAGLDVFDHEPLDANDPLRTLDNVILTPHVAWRNDEARDNLTRQVIESVTSFLNGRDMNRVV